MGHLGLDLCPIDRELDPGRRALEPIQVLTQRERPALVQPDDLEHPVASVETVVADRHHRLLGRCDPPVDADDLSQGHRRARLSKMRVSSRVTPLRDSR